MVAVRKYSSLLPTLADFFFTGEKKRNKGD